DDTRTFTGHAIPFWRFRITLRARGAPGDSRVAVRCLGALRRIRLPLLATGTAPIVLPRAKAAVVAFVEPEALDVLADETLDELEVVATIGRRRQQLRFEQPIEADQRRIPRKLVLDQRRRRIGPFVLERQREERVQQVERRVLRLVVAQYA